MRTFLKKNKLILIIAFLLTGVLFTQPISFKVADSQYLWHKDSVYHNPILSSPDGFHLFVEPVEGTEVVVFSESGVWKCLRETTDWEKRPHEYRISYEELAEGNENASAFLQPIVWYPRYDLVYDENGNINEQNAETFCDYLGVIVKKDGVIVSSSLYKLTGSDSKWRGNVQELAVWEYPFLNGFVTETYVKSQLRKEILFDRLCFWNETDLEALSNFQPPYSSTYNP